MTLADAIRRAICCAAGADAQHPPPPTELAAALGIVVREVSPSQMRVPLLLTRLRGAWRLMLRSDLDPADRERDVGQGLAYWAVGQDISHEVVGLELARAATGTGEKKRVERSCLN